MEQKPKTGIFRRFIDLLFNAYLVWLVAYWLLVCQNPDKSSDSSICHTISATRENVLEPYAYPLIKQALSYPPIQPYVTEIEPYVIRAQQVLQPVAATVVSKFSTHIIPEWNNHVVPRYHTYVAPHVQSVLVYLDPYVAVVGAEYERYLAPYVRVTTATGWKLQEKARPYVIFAWDKSVDGYKYAKPYARPAWERLKDAVLRVLAYLAVLRRQFVDPHVAQMWAKIKELSGDKVVPTTTNPTVTPKPVPVVGILVEEPSTVAAILVEEDSRPLVPAPTPIPPPVLGDGPTDTVDIPKPVETEVVPQEEEPQISDSTNQEPAPAVAPSNEAPAPTPTRSSEQETPVPSVNYEDEGDFESFSTEMGLDQDDPEVEVNEEIQIAPPEESEEEREARLKAKAEETAWKRKEITDRHTDWEYQLEDLKAQQMQVFRLALYNVRKTAAKMLKKDSSVQRAVNEFAADGDRYLRGAESYLKNLIKEKKQDKGALWERVVQKVEDKFDKRLDAVDRKVGDWYNEVATDERAMVVKATTAVADFALKAQVDLGLDYSWLDDVTVNDWTRYHDLMRCGLILFWFLKYELLTISLAPCAFLGFFTASDSFHEEVLMVRNGTHVEALDNPVFRALKELRVEVEDIITGFKSRLRRIQRDGERTFGAVNQDEDSPMSILPIADEESIPQVTIGKGSEQVAEALKEAPLEDWAASKQKKADEVRIHEEL